MPSSQGAPVATATTTTASSTASASAAASAEPVDAGAVADCTPFASSHSRVGLPPGDLGMVSNATADAAFDRSHTELTAAVQKRIDKLRCCYDFARQTRPGIEGTLVIESVLQPDGTLTQASHDKGRSEIKDDAMGACAVAVWKDIRFPASKRGRPTTVSYPISFRPAGGDR
jgi:hypothetical protein